LKYYQQNPGRDLWGWQKGYVLSKASEQGDGAKKTVLQT